MYKDSFRELEQSVFEAFEEFHRIVILVYRDIEKSSQIYSNFVNFERPPMIYEVVQLENTLYKLLKGNFSNDVFTMKPKLKTNNSFAFGEKETFLITKLGPTSHWDYRPNIQNSSRKKKLKLEQIEIA